VRVIGKAVTAGKMKKGEKVMDYNIFLELVECIAQANKTDAATISGKLGSVGGPSTAGTTGVANKEITGKMTDTKQYTGAARERFDKDGKGKGIDGREDRSANTGYVGNYKEAGTYDKKH
jgi:hypothetical protein